MQKMRSKNKGKRKVLEIFLLLIKNKSDKSEKLKGIIGF